MIFSKYLDSKRELCRALIGELGKAFKYASILGTDVKETTCAIDRRSSSVRDGEGECGFVVRLHDGNAFFEYSFDDFSGDIHTLAEKIMQSTRCSEALQGKMIRTDVLHGEKMAKDFVRESDFNKYTDKQVLDFCEKMRDEISAKDERIVNAVISVRKRFVSKLFISQDRELSQVYGWANGYIALICNEDRMVQTYDSVNSNMLSDIFDGMPKQIDRIVDKALHLLKATPIEPGVYDIITDSSITGLIAHEAFGHGVEMDQFVKDRALAKNCMGEYVASPIASMRDGAAATLSAASYFFDDDGVIAGDTQIIKDGILVAGLSDIASASQLGTSPTGNGRRESYKRKAYSRMTNTFFEKGDSTLDEMIASVKHGYMLFQTNNGMEDPKNWQIQCTAEYGIEIVDGKLTDHYVSPVVMSGFVPDLLKSISMVSDGSEVIGSGYCGKGYKEWVPVSDGGPNLKVRVKLG